MINLFDNYHIETAGSNEEFGEFFKKSAKIVFDSGTDFHPQEALTQQERDHGKTLSENLKDMYRLQMYILHRDEKIGWFTGIQKDSETFDMSNTGIFKEHRNKGIYRSMLPHIMEIVKGKGFQKISSRHIATNNVVIIAKLKAGFKITGFEINDKYGILVHLSYFFNDIRNDIIEYRTGGKKADDSFMKFIG